MKGREETRCYIRHLFLSPFPFFYLRRSRQVLELCKLLLGLWGGLVCQSTQARLLFFPIVFFLEVGANIFWLFLRINLWLSFPLIIFFGVGSIAPLPNPIV